MREAPVCGKCGGRHWGTCGAARAAGTGSGSPGPEAGTGGLTTGSSNSTRKAGRSSAGSADTGLFEVPTREFIVPARRGRPKRYEYNEAIEAARPWEAEGMSRRTWYRRRAEDRGD